MALKATIYKVNLGIADMDRGVYADQQVTIARHPSETDERMMLRLLALGLYRPASDANGMLEFAKGLWDTDEPDLWQKDLTGAIEIWIDVGQPDERRIRRACGRAGQVYVYSYGRQGAGMWWEQIKSNFERSRNLTVVQLPAAAVTALAKRAQRNMQLNCTIQDGQVWMSDASETVQLELVTVKMPPTVVY